MDAASNTPKGERLDILVTLVERELGIPAESLIRPPADHRAA